jgi:nucleotide-binding universal stress UspA family protein
MAAVRPIIVPIDGSEASEVGLRVAVPLAQATGMPIVLIWVYEGLQGLDRGLPQEDAEAADRAEIARRREALAEVQQRVLEPAGVEHELLVAMGSAPEGILQAAAERDARVIVMATHSRGALPRWYMGSVAMEVANTSTVPTILFHADADRDPPTIYRRIATPIELIEQTHVAIEAAALTANELGAELVLLTLSESVEEAADAHRWNSVLSSRYPDLTIQHETRAEPLIDALRELALEVDLLVMPMRDQEGWRRFFSGEEWDNVVREAGVPVMLVRAREGAADAKPEAD